MVSIQSKNKIRLYTFCINTKNKLLTILKNEKISKYIKIYIEIYFFLQQIAYYSKCFMVSNQSKIKKI